MDIKDLPCDQLEENWWQHIMIVATEGWFNDV